MTHEEIAPLPGCELRLTIRWDGHGAEYKGELTLSFSDTALEVEFNGTAVKDFRSNRIGLIVLHGPDNAGIPCEVTSPDGGKLSSAFPLGISPHQPFKNVAALAWERDQVRYRLDFDGDVFETEDQRNWTDASFKTYSTPLERPFPVNNRPGDHVRQAVRLSVKHRIDITDTVTGSVPELGTATGVEDGDVRPRTLPATFGPLLAEVSARPNAAFATISPAEA
ncbi:hypothetical protein [Pseudarthrobacter niigatensis]|uniref:D-apionate lactonase N-terminal domain-containing protein n=1 Tax=Pseudarthrobacter niigatensis TaxID=369935 RepID=A0AAJ1SPG0_9MICC|nr:hypothetical protein [Pseudarthrobacter niigatensis]MDQ0144641.1 hypothetical protein [Pseudarthrobacter niigatensis]MDQ0265287.1 hypothetical protein [Pseudarthrobacter niigatensis]